jgi:hypothetical protein
MPKIGTDSSLIMANLHQSAVYQLRESGQYEEINFRYHTESRHQSKGTYISGGILI